MNSSLCDYLPILMQIAFSILFVVVVIIISNYLGPRHRSNRKNANFECGLDSIGNARTPFPVRYFLIALIFVLFDLEIVFMYPWAIDYRMLGFSAFLKMIGFIVLVFIGFLYIKKRKALDWEKRNPLSTIKSQDNE